LQKVVFDVDLANNFDREFKTRLKDENFEIYFAR